MSGIGEPLSHNVAVHVLSGALFVVAGLACLRYAWIGASTFEREPPFLALGVVLSGIGAGLILSTRAAHLLARAALGIVILAVAVKAARLYADGAPAYPDERLVAHVYLLGFALAAAGTVIVFLLLRRARSAAEFTGLDLVPLGGLAVALLLGGVWLVGEDARLRPCGNGSDEACGRVAVALLESAERAPGAAPTAAEERAARVLAAHRCRAEDRGQCGLQRYAVGTVDARARRLEHAKEAFMWACDADTSWCARAVQEPVDWTPEERSRLTRPARWERRQRVVR
jgi:hypothetical protein